MHHLYYGVPGWLICGGLAAWIATSKGRGGCLWFGIGLFGPVGLLIAVLVPRAGD